ncbi:Sirohydrochlorin cobaltochelatase [Salmonella enterica subsp. arizonae]|uniref:Sirohydrochlorin cobaltochelatase n=1 Tax=Salmonella enterica subsp. arizonae TaxID=59203 RepID=A0A2X4T6I4_SALER|nr:Sirohydrochlorin cobaltochelatase [Salmonella enterica subsp. arizonae]
MKKALLVVSFGTSYHDTCEKILWRASAIWRRPVPIATCFAPSLPE